MGREEAGMSECVFWQDDSGLYKREEIVRCRDCRHAIPVTSDPPWLDCTGPLVETWDWQHDEPRMNPVEPEGFCSWGKRRDA